MMPVPDPRPLLEPETVAVIGASESPQKPGHILLRNILDGGFPGRVFPINPKAETIADLPCYSSVEAVPETIDLAFIVLGRERVPAALAECAKASVRSVCIITAGFAEGDSWGKNAQQRLSGLVAESGIAAIGPNTIGLVSMGGKLLGTFVPFPQWKAGSVAIVAQTGIFAGAVMLELMTQSAQRIGIYASVDIGNRVGIDELVLLNTLAADERVDVLGFYLESLADARGFLRRAAEVKRRKPIVILKPGRTPHGALASESHTGSLAQDDAVLDQLLAQHGIVRASNASEFLAFLKTFSYAPLPCGPRIGLITYSGALGVIATDELASEGLELAKLDGKTLAAISDLMPNWQRAGNPSDLWSAVERDAQRTAEVSFSAMLADPNVDQVLGVMLAVPNADFEGLGRTYAKLRTKYPDKPLHLVLHGALKGRWMQELDELGIPIHNSTDLAIRSMAAATRYVRTREYFPHAHTHG